MKRQFLSIILSVTLLASAIAGAISVSIKSADADTSDYIVDDVLYWKDFKQYISGLYPTSTQLIILQSIYDQVENYWNDPRFNLFIMSDNSGNVTLMTCYNTETNYTWLINDYTSQNPIPYFLQTRTGSASNCYYNQMSFIHIKQDVVLDLRYSSSTFNCLDYKKTSATNLSTESRSNYYFPTPYDRSAGTHIFVLKNLILKDDNSVLFASNIINESYTPPVYSFAWLKYNVGDRWFITPQDQTWTYGLVNDGEGSYNAIYISLGFNDMESDISEAIFTDFTDYVSTPAIFVPAAQNLINDTVYGFEITEFLDLGLTSIGYSWINKETENSSGEVINRQLLAVFDGTFSVSLSAQEENPSLNEAWQQFNEYVTNYNSTHVIPEQLADWLFEQNGSKLFPVTVSVPGNIWLHDHGTSYTQHNWIWGGLNAATQAFAYDLFDVCICGANDLNLTMDRNYQLRYFVDDILDPMYNNVSTISFSELIDSFDIVIIVPEDEGYLHDICLTSNIAYCGSSGNSIVYQGTAITGNNLTGFAIVTERGIAKQQLWNFNDGITKLYDLEVKYIDSEDKWKDSFLLWSASMFDMLNSLDGRLSTINTNLLSISSLIDHIKTAVDHIAYDDDPNKLQPWYLSLWNWISNFRPSDSDFAATLNQYDDNWDNFPELPAPSTIPLLPGG